MSSASTPVSPSPTLTLLPPSSGSPASLIWWRPSPPPPRKLNSFSDRRPVKLDSLSIPPTKSWQEFVSSAFSTPSGTPNCILSLACGQFGGGGSQRQDSPLQSISNSPVSPSSPSFVPPSLGCPSSVSPPSPLSPSYVPPFQSPSPPLLSPPLVSPPPPRKPSPFSTPTKSRQGLISSASSTPLSSPTCTLCIQCGGGSKRKSSPLLSSPSSGAKNSGGGSTPPSAAAKKRWMNVRNALKQMQYKWMMDNISQQLKQQSNGAPVIAVNEKPNIDINNQRVYGTVPSEQNAGVVQEVVHDENVSFDRDGDTMRVCYMCCCGRQKQIFFAIPN
ncbi:hypothetical protein MKW92_027416 [Papaver armeniacum]|nr:hypothetical protein MKW92_027416 [Papaver armeniacum]